MIKTGKLAKEGGVRMFQMEIHDPIAAKNIFMLVAAILIN